MPRVNRKKPKKPGLTEYRKEKNVLELAIHARNEAKRHERENSPDFLERMQQIIEEQLGEDDTSSDDSGDAGVLDGQGMEFNGGNGDGQYENADGYTNGDGYDGGDGDGYGGMAIAFQEEPPPEIRLAFDLEAVALEDQEASDAEEVGEEEDVVETQWDQAGPVTEEGENDRWRREADTERWEDEQRHLLEYEHDHFTLQDSRDLEGLAYNFVGSHSRNDLERLVKMNGLSSPYILKKKLEHFFDLVDQPYDCCVDSCMAFTGPYSKLEKCQICGEDRYDNCGKPRNIFRYLPLIPRLQAFFKSERIIDMLQYRQEREPYDGTLRDVFDSDHFQELLNTTVKIDGVEYPHKIGESEWDIFVGFTFDGVSLWRGLGSLKARASTTCWPMAVIIYSFNPTIRTRLEHIFSLGVIPGPHSPKHINSFIFPFHAEARRSAIGIPTYNSRLDCIFDMHWYPIFGTADMPVLAKANGGKGAGAIAPCQKCPIKGLRDPTKRYGITYYLPHQHPGEGEESQTDYLLDNPKTHQYFKEVWYELTQAPTATEYKRVGQEHGVTCVPLLGLLPSINIPNSFPYGLMHLLFENLAPNMFSHWTGKFKTLEPDHDPYYLDEDICAIIGQETIGCVCTTPSTMIRAMPDIFLHSTKFTAESWAFWITWLAPYLLQDRLPNRHYQHLLLLVDIIKMATSLEITQETLEKLDASTCQWHAEYEELYYRYEMGRISTCPLTIHALIHIASSTRQCGPLSRIWEFVTERYMGKVARNVTSRQYPFSQIAETIKKGEQLKTVAMKFGLEEKLFQADERRDWSILGSQERMILEINDTTVLMSPYEATYRWTTAERRLAAVYIKQAEGLRASAQLIAKELPERIQRWGKYRVHKERNVVRSAWAAGRISKDRLRDSSYVRIELLVDTNADDPALPDEPELQVFYGQLLYIARVTLPANRKIQMRRECDVLLGIVQLCKDAIGDASIRPVWYREMGNKIAVNISTVQCAIGRVKVGENWGILDLNYACANTTFLDDDGRVGEEDD